MKCVTPEISWHNRDPVLSVDIQRCDQCKYKIASGGADCHVILWNLIVTESGEYSNVEPVADLTKHQKSVNVVRWAPSRNMLASGDDESIIIIWHPKTDAATAETQKHPKSSADVFSEQWSIYKVLRGHLEDVYDLCWFSDSSKLLSGSVDNSVILWNVDKGKNIGLASGHNGFVQGIAIDPQDKVFATTCSDRNLRVFDAKSRKLLHKIDKAVCPVRGGSDSGDHPLKNVPIKLFYDDTLKAFYRRLSFSPDGLFLAVPSGFVHNEDKSIKFNTTYLFSKHDFKQPILSIPSDDQFSIAVRFCPLTFELKPDGPKPMIPLPYRMIYATALKNSVLICDTQHEIPIAKIMNIHYTRLTDLAWSSNGRILLISSSDGFCTFVTFDENELGTPSKQYDCESLLSSGIFDPVSKATADVIITNVSNGTVVPTVTAVATTNVDFAVNGSPLVKKIAVKRKSKVVEPDGSSSLLMNWTKKPKTDDHLQP